MIIRSNEWMAKGRKTGRCGICGKLKDHPKGNAAFHLFNYRRSRTVHLNRTSATDHSNKSTIIDTAGVSGGVRSCTSIPSLRFSSSAISIPSSTIPVYNIFRHDRERQIGISSLCVPLLAAKPGEKHAEYNDDDDGAGDDGTGLGCGEVAWDFWG